ncbi:hypothetical protein AYO21_11247 [Fonsecaea monophora]|uniref:Uncharacterized protein n=2 Tax=Fonsecaea TaxID=40354 RepID=A0A0D2G5G5_9EURO|nr:uncharacterized protein Z517_10668 [Fonsecaea pedrosoi CBS 271.37]XP_022506554.1 hypothetical protein AYO21_11247 [Fonsecaea monophora]KAH0846469.1 hypothetical protein FOPE_12570 [Fonsecaea pedrosoi]KIW75923.1 hypothetical protein Z517_10668 [Fonsecaea pedrosoi CBS 271.37]OAG34602.1 hypothetical protein AYO21_11247 [Fonsecaea monophora]
MLLERTALSKQHAASRTTAELQMKEDADGQRPLTCMFYFFASQMKRNVQPADQDLVRRGKLEDKPTHQLDSMITRLGMHAAFSPLISKFETYPVQIPETDPASREEVHDTVMIMKFRDKRARQEWIATKQWQDFMEETESQQVFRRMPHVRCASSLRGLMDPIDIVTA